MSGRVFFPGAMSVDEYREYQRTGKVPEAVTGKATPVSVPKRTNKYNVGPRHLRQLDGYTFDSIAERKRYELLRAWERGGEVRTLRVHPEWPLVVNGEHVASYEADFTYELHMADGSWQRVVEDVKGVLTEAYRLKKRLMRAIHGIDIEEVET